MKTYSIRSRVTHAVFFTIITALFFSCASGIGSLMVEEVPAAASLPPEKPEPEISVPQTPPPEKTPERPPVPPVPEYIMGSGNTEARSMAEFLLASNPAADADFARALAEHYTEEAGDEGVNHDVAFAQMCLETGFLAYGGLVTPDMNNFCGLGALSAERPGERFPDPAAGVRAHIQHLKAYATDEPLKKELVDPRYFYVRQGSSPTIKGLAGTWASDKMYAEKINNILVRLYQFSFEKM